MHSANCNVESKFEFTLQFSLCILKLPEGVEMVMPGDSTTITGELITPVAIEKGSRFAIREGGRTVGAGTITEIIL